MRIYKFPGFCKFFLVHVDYYTPHKINLNFINFFLDKQIDLNNVDLKKLKVKDLKKILNDWDETCDGCLEKPDFIKRIEELKPKYQGGAQPKKEL